MLESESRCYVPQCDSRRINALVTKARTLRAALAAPANGDGDGGAQS
jgi:hypothetical protein